MLRPREQPPLVSQPEPVKTALPNRSRPEMAHANPPAPRPARPVIVAGPVPLDHQPARITGRPSGSVFTGGTRSGTNQRPHHAPAGPARTEQPSQFARRHQRGPLSAILIGVVVGLCLVAAASGGIYYFMDQRGLLDKEPPRVSHDADYEQAMNFVKAGQYSFAIEKLRTLPPSARRDRRLAQIFFEQGNSIREQNTSGAIEAYRQAFQYYPANPEYGIRLGWEYYSLGRDMQADDPNQARVHLQSARQTFEAVLETHASNQQALLTLGHVAGALGDAVTQNNSYRRVIEIAADTPEALSARQHLRTLNFTP